MPYIINERFVWVNSYTIIDLQECKSIEIELPEGVEKDDLTEADVEEFFREYNEEMRKN